MGLRAKASGAPNDPLTYGTGGLGHPEQLRPADHGPGLGEHDVLPQPGYARFLWLPESSQPLLRRALAFADSRALRVPRLWDLLSARGRQVIVLGVPQTYPVSRVNGVMVSCFLTPDTEQSQYTYPPELKSEIERVVGRYMVDV